jgi:hypothetical protein
MGNAERQGHARRVRLGLACAALRHAGTRTSIPAFKAKYVDTGKVNYVAIAKILTPPQPKWPPPAFHDGPLRRQG